MAPPQPDPAIGADETTGGTRVVRRLITSARVRWWLSFLVFAALGALWALSSPLMSVPDEPSHAIKAAAVADGQWRGRPVPVEESLAGPARIDIHVSLRRDLADAALLKNCYAFHQEITAGCQPDLPADRTRVDAATTAGTYPPVYYLLVGWPSRFLGGRAALLAMRLCSVVLGAALLASGLASAVRAAPSRFLVSGAALAATPMAFFLIGAINPNGFEIAAAYATWLAWLDLLGRRTRPPGRLLIRVAVASAAFLAARPLSPAFFGLALLGVLAMAATRANLRLLARDRRVWWAGGAIVVATGASVAWTAWSGSTSPKHASPIPGLTFTKALQISWDSLWFRTQQLFGVFGWLDTSTPSWFTWGWLGATALVVLLALAVGRWRWRLVVVATVAASVVVPLVAEAVGAPSVGFIWQGRYTLPLAMGVPVLAAWAVASRPEPARWLVRTRAVVVVGAAVAVAFGQFVAHGAALSRYVVGQPSSWLAYLHGDGWVPPWGVWGQFAFALGTCVAYAALLAILGHDRPAMAPPSHQPTHEQLVAMIVPDL